MKNKKKRKWALLKVTSIQRLVLHQKSTGKVDLCWLHKRDKPLLKHETLAAAPLSVPLDMRNQGSFEFWANPFNETRLILSFRWVCTSLGRFYPVLCSAQLLWVDRTGAMPTGHTGWSGCQNIALGFNAIFTFFGCTLLCTLLMVFIVCLKLSQVSWLLASSSLSRFSICISEMTLDGTCLCLQVTCYKEIIPA